MLRMASRHKKTGEARRFVQINQQEKSNYLASGFLGSLNLAPPALAM